MSIFDDDQNLPGVITQIEADYAIDYNPAQFGSTDSVCLIGTAFDGPVGVPVPIYSPEHGAYIFGGAFDNTKRQEATLVPGIQDAWNRGCRTIYGVRLGGKEMYKDFEFCIDTEYRLRVSSRYPSNSGKECFLKYDDKSGEKTFTLFKPASRATISEKKAGRVEGTNKMLSVTVNLESDYSLTKDSNLVDAIRIFNNVTGNNALQLSIVDPDGNDVTDVNETKSLALGILYPGIYFIGRAESNRNVTAVTDVTFNPVVNSDGEIKPYTAFTEKYFRSLQCNTDVTQSYPIYIPDGKENDYFGKAGITSVTPWDFLYVSNVTDRIFTPDNIDYEETALSKFEIYKRLGSGFAVTAHIVQRTEGGAVRVQETDSDDVNHIVPIKDGVYSLLQDAEIKYRVLTCANADDSISGKLPRRDDFRVTSSTPTQVLGGLLNVSPKVDKYDFTKSKSYSFEFVSAAKGSTSIADTKDIYMDRIFPVIGTVGADDVISTKDYANGTLIMKPKDGTTDGTMALNRVGEKEVTILSGAGIKDKGYIADGKLYICNDNDGSFVAAQLTAGSADKSKALYNGKRFILGSILGHIFVYEAVDATATSAFDNIGNLNTLLSADDHKFIIAAEDVQTPNHTNKIKVICNYFNDMTIEELAEEMNNNQVLSKLFATSLTSDGSKAKDMFVSENTVSLGVLGKPGVKLAADRFTGYDKTAYIPYRTTDNFARQLAQHCLYTELKTTPTHGIIGTHPMINTGLSSIAQKVSELAKRDFSMYAKNDHGHNMLDRNALPYPIGKNATVIFGQYTVTMSDGSYTTSSNGAAGYAGMISVLPLDQSSTAQPINISQLSFSLTQSQLKALTAAGIVTLRKSFTKGIVVTDGITMAPADSVYRRLSVNRIIGSVQDLIRAASEPYIGKQNHAANRNALHTAITSALNKIKGTLIENYSFAMNTDPRIEKFSYIEINFKIIPIYEIREVRSSIKVVDSLSS